MATAFALGGGRRSASPMVTEFSPQVMSAINADPSMFMPTSGAGGQAPYEDLLSQGLYDYTDLTNSSGGNASGNIGNTSSGMSASAAGALGQAASTIGAVTGNPALGALGGMMGLAGQANSSSNPGAALGAFGGMAANAIGQVTGIPGIGAVANAANTATNMSPNATTQAVMSESAKSALNSVIATTPIGLTAQAISQLAFNTPVVQAIINALNPSAQVVAAPVTEAVVSPNIAPNQTDPFGSSSGSSEGGFGSIGSGTGGMSMGVDGAIGLGPGSGVAEGTFGIGSEGVTGTGFGTDSNSSSGDAGASAKIICTHLYQVGLMPRDIYEADQRYGKKLLATAPNTYYGYVRWAYTVVRWMCRDDLFGKFVTFVTKHVAMPWAYAMAEQEGKDVKSSAYGRWLLRNGLKFCAWLGPKKENRYGY